MNGDAGKLRQVLFNLLGNAVKFTERGRVSLELTQAAPDRIRFEVKDTGIGIAPGELRDIFLAFHQARGSKLDRAGHGLGPRDQRTSRPAARRQLQVTSEVGRGSRFWFEIPLPAIAPAADAPYLTRHVCARFRPASADRRGGWSIADDAPTNRNVLRELLEPLGFEIDEAADGAECLQKCAQNRPDAVLLDLQMPGVDGFEVARALRRNLGSARRRSSRFRRAFSKMRGNRRSMRGAMTSCRSRLRRSNC